MRVFKFGGSSVATAERVQSVLEIVCQAAMDKRDPCVAVVFSACGGVTDILLELGQSAARGDKSYLSRFDALSQRHIELVRGILPIAAQSHALAQLKTQLNELNDVLHGIALVSEISPRTRDQLLSFGERLSAHAIAEALKGRLPKVTYLDAREVIVTDENFGNAQVDRHKSYEAIKRYAADHPGLLVVTGFIGRSVAGNTTTLGRGGSDLSAALIGAALKAREIEIWTDVDGVMTADPRKVKEAIRIPNMTYDEAMEMSHFGAKVIYPPTMQPALEMQIPIRIKNTLNPSSPGTLIGPLVDSKEYVRGISSIDKIALLNVQGSGMIGVAGIAQRLFGALAQARISVILISQASSEHSICFAVNPSDSEGAVKAVENAFALEIAAGLIDRVRADEDLSIVALVGDQMRKVAGISGKLFSALGRNGINVIAISQGSSERNISVVIRHSDVTKAVQCLHDAFFLAGKQSLHLYVLGVGLIGKTLLSQIAHKHDELKQELGLDVKLVGVADTKHMLVAGSETIGLSDWPKRFSQSEEKSNPETFVTRIIELNRPNSIFLDCTSSNEVTAQYERVLAANISIVTPNKKANSASFDQYRRLGALAKRRGVHFLYEANVGAGLPVISTVKSLRNSGDRILKIEAILSGTLSYVFNRLSKDVPFSQVVREAKAKGYTEPDPRTDFLGEDAARKLLILAREAGLPLEFSDIHVEPLLPKQEPKSVDEWMNALESLDPYFEEKRKKAEAKGAALRFVGVLEGNKARAGLVEVDSSHPCYSVSGNDNLFSFTTERYSERPLVVKGPGAGADVTAAQLFADVIQVSKYLLG